MMIGELFGALVILAGAVVWLSREPVLQKLWLVLLIEWASTNLAVDYMGFENAMLVIPSINGLLAICVAILGLSNWQRRAGVVAAVLVFALYAAVGVTHLAAFVTRTDGSNLHYATLNGLFSLQLLTLGGVGGWLAVRLWTSWRRQRLGADHPRSTGVAEGP